MFLQYLAIATDIFNNCVYPNVANIINGTIFYGKPIWYIYKILPHSDTKLSVVTIDSLGYMITNNIYPLIPVSLVITPLIPTISKLVVVASIGAMASAFL